MTFRLTPDDCDMFADVAEYRLLTLSQIAILHGRNIRSLRRRFRSFEEDGLVRSAPQRLGSDRGRPEGVISLTEGGVDLLKSRGRLAADIPSDHATADRISCVDHQLLVNMFRIQLTRFPRIVPGLRLQFFSPLSPTLQRSEDDRPWVYEAFRGDRDEGEWIRFTPDGVFTLTFEKLGKTLLFFLEADRGTETLASPTGGGTDIRGKLLNYQTYFHRKKYKRYEQTCGAALRGFRLLFLTNTRSRIAAMCRLVREAPPSDFIWLTDQTRLASDGAWAAIWARGGHLDRAPESILGSQLPVPAPKPDELG